MGGYVMNFAVYTMAMTGLIFFALMVYKKCTFPGGIKSSKTKMLNIEETMSIAPRKTLYVVKAGNERFLIASDIDKTTLISKLDNNETINNISNNIEHETKNELSKEIKKEVTKETTKSTETKTEKEEVKKEIKPVNKVISAQVTNIKTKIQKNKTEIKKEPVKTEIKKEESVDELPIIVDFQKKVQQKNVLHDMLKKINE